MPRVLILNGPNLNMLGAREPEIYGSQTLDDIRALAQAKGQQLGLEVDFRQTNSEGQLIGWVHEAMTAAEGIIVNGGAYSHTSIALLDALRGCGLPVVEVHLSNLFRREFYRPPLLRQRSGARTDLRVRRHRLRAGTRGDRPSHRCGHRDNLAKAVAGVAPARDMGRPLSARATMNRLTPEILLQAYAQGLFPMAEDRDDPRLFWNDPETRGIIPLDAFHVPRRLARKVRNDLFEVRTDRAFGAVIEACARAKPGRWATWINDEILSLYTRLHDMGHAHSVECWRGDTLVGGLYGISLGAGFFGESMFSVETDSSKVALVHLVARLKRGRYRLLDTQFVTRHLARFGTVEVPRAQYRALLASAMVETGDFHALPHGCPGASVLQSITQTS